MTEKKYNFEITPYNLEYQDVLCTGVAWEDEAFEFEYKGKKYFYKQMEKYDCSADTDHIRCVIEEFLRWLTHTLSTPKRTNFDKIVSSVESLAEFLAPRIICADCPYWKNRNCVASLPCEEALQEWLQKECEE